MTDEVAADDIDVVRLTVLLRDLNELLGQLSEADRLMETDKCQALKVAAGLALQLQCRIGSQLRSLLGLPPLEQGAALRQLVAATLDWDSPTSKGRGAPKLATINAIDRVPEALAMELLRAKDPTLSPELAAEEVINLLRDRYIAALVRRWRQIRTGGDSLAAEIFEQNLDEVKCQVAARGGTADAYSLVIETMLTKKIPGRSGWIRVFD